MARIVREVSKINPQINEIQKFISLISEKNHLSEVDSSRVFQIIMSGGATPAQISAILMGLKINQETVDEITGAVKALRLKAVKFNIDDDMRTRIVDTCGTGGDKKGSYNISTTAAFVVAASGVPVVKHGNKAISSKAGSSDVLTSLGVNVEASQELYLRSLEEINICFLMAPKYHNAMKYVAPVRQELSVRTIFNILGPMINPAFPIRQVMGVYDRSLVEPIANVLNNLGTEHAFVVHGLDGMDEITIMDKTFIAEVKDGEVNSFELDPLDYGFEIPEDENCLKGGDGKFNALALKEVLKGKEGPYRDIVLLNSAASLYVGGVASNIEEGVEIAKEAIDSRKAYDALMKLVEITNL